MANDNQADSRTFLAIVLGGIVLALVIAAYVMYGSRHETSVKVDQPAATEPAAPPMAPAPPMTAPEAPSAETPSAETPAAPAAPPANTP